MSIDRLLYGTDLFGDSAAPRPTGPVNERFGFPPFSVLDGRGGDWLERKRAWLSLGIKSELGRGGDLAYDQASLNRAMSRLGRQPNAVPGGSPMVAGYGPNGERLTGLVAESGTSVFDPVLCEMAYRWWVPKAGQVLDPFAGGSVRGIIAKSLGLRYWGCDLRQEQVDANIEQATTIFPGYDGRTGDLLGGPDLEWVCGDSADQLAAAPMADFVFSCPPYGDLELYSDDPRDLSNMRWGTFVTAYNNIIERTAARLRNDSFAAFVVGDFRDESGHYRNFVGETVAAWEAAGLALYNEAILVSPVGSACLRVTRQFNGGRKLVKVHQNLLVFVKGDWRRAAARCQAVES